MLLFAIEYKMYKRGIGMKQVILSADYEKVIYLVPDIVADHLREYCEYFNTITTLCYSNDDSVLI